MASVFYDKLVPDYMGGEKGYCVIIRENDGGIGISMQPEGKNPTNSEDEYAVFMDIQEARELINGLEEAVARAAAKSPRLTGKVRDCH